MESEQTPGFDRNVVLCGLDQMTKTWIAGLADMLRATVNWDNSMNFMEALSVGKGQWE